MTYHFRNAITSEAKPLVGLYAESGCGKTKSALLLACGFVNGDMSKVGMIETESGRGEAYAGEPLIGGYKVLPIREEFSPTTYGKAISAAEDERLQCLIVDSSSHEWEGLGGVLGMAAKNQAEGKKGPLVWQKPKMDHAREFMLRLTQTPIPLVIVCMRAKYPMKEIKHADMEWWEKSGQQGKPPKLGEWIRSSRLEPKQSEDILYEMFVHGWIDKEHNFHCTKYTIDALRKVFIDGAPITIDTGKRLAHWAAGGTNKEPEGRHEPAAADQTLQGRPVSAVRGTAPADVGSQEGVTARRDEQPHITVDQVTYLGDQCREHGIATAKLCEKAGVPGIGFILAQDYQRAVDWLNASIERRKSA